MGKIISATEARIRFGELMRQAQLGPVIVERDGHPQVVVLSIQAYENLAAAQPAPGWRQLLDEVHQRVRLELGGRRLPSPEEMLQQVREERDATYDLLH